MKRTLSFIVTLAMLLSLFTVFAATPASAATVISNTSPAIRANVGETITLSNYSVTFDGDTTATSNVTWKNGSTTITTFKPTAKGVTTLTATSGSKTKNIYVVAKNASDTEYVLYEATMSNFSSVSALTNAGWTFTKSANASKGSDGSLVLGVTGRWDATSAYLPSWLGDFGNYKFAANVKFTAFGESDTTRWFSLMTRAENLNCAAHYTHAAFRGNNTASNGIEFAERYATDSGSDWNVALKTPGTYSSLTDAYRDFSILSVDNNFRVDIAGKQMLYVDSSSYLSLSKKQVYKGYLGFQASGCTIAIKSVKVTLEDTVPEEIIDTSLIYNNYHDAANLVNPIANIQRVSGVTAANLSKLSVAYIDLTTGINAQTAFKTCMDNNVVPTFYATTTAHANAVIAASTALGSTDATVVSNSESVLNTIRVHSTAYPIRTGLVVDISTEMADGTMTDYEADVIRRRVRAIPATFMVIESKYATKQAVAELQEMALAVWVNVTSTPGTDAFNIEAMKAITSGANGLITDSAAEVSSLIKTHIQARAFTRTPITIGHRGNPGVAAENTIESFQAAYENGGDVFEIDVECTKDGVIVILHDGTLTRTTTYTGSTSIRNMTWAEAQKYHVLDLDGNSTGKPIPTLKEVLDWAKGKDIKIFVEFKDNSTTCVNGTMADIVERGMTQQVDIISFNTTALKLARAAVPGISTGYLNGNDITGSTYSMALKLFEGRIEPAQREWSTVNCGSYNNQVTNLAVQVATDRGMTMWPWTYGYGNTSAAFFDCPDGITTDNMEVMKDMVKTVHAKNFVMLPGQTYGGGALTSETYGNTFTSVSADNTIVSVVAGDSVKVENGKLVAVKEGISTVVMAVKSWTYLGKEYIVYSQPVQVRVGTGDPAVLEPLVEMAKEATIYSLSESDLASLREYCDKAVELINSSNPKEAEVKATAEALNNLLAKFIVEKYTAPAPNYYKWDSATGGPSTELNETYSDDGVRLVDGKKSQIAGNTTAYSAWQKTDDGKIEIVLDCSNPAERDTFKAYFAANSIWGVKAPANMEVSYSTDNKTFTQLDGATLTKRQIPDVGELSDNVWNRWEYTVKASSVVTARYYKFTIYFEGSFIWIDEIEAANESSELIYINKVNSRINAGEAGIYTSSFGELNKQTANNIWTVNITAKWDASKDAYVVSNVAFGDGTDKPVTIASDEIYIAVHEWELNTLDELPVVGSAHNLSLAKVARVGDVVEFYGIDTETWEFGPAPSIKFVSEDNKGDLNNNGEIDAVDYSLLKRAYFGIFASNTNIADINGNGEVDAVDYSLLKRAYFGIYSIA